MKKLLPLLLVLHVSCHSVREEKITDDSIADAEKLKSTEQTFDEISTENLVRFFSSNFHLVGNNPCILVDSASGTIFVSGKNYLRRFPPDSLNAAADNYLETLRYWGYEPNGAEKIDTMTHVSKDGKDYVVVNMNDLLPEMTSEERSRFHGQQVEVMRNTPCSDAYHYLAVNRHCPNIYASSSGLTFEGKDSAQVFDMNNATAALKAFKAAQKK